MEQATRADWWGGSASRGARRGDLAIHHFDLIRVVTSLKAREVICPI